MKAGGNEIVGEYFICENVSIQSGESIGCEAGIGFFISIKCGDCSHIVIKCTRYMELLHIVRRRFIFMRDL